MWLTIVNRFDLCSGYGLIRYTVNTQKYLVDATSYLINEQIIFIHRSPPKDGNRDKEYS